MMSIIRTHWYIHYHITDKHIQEQN